MSSYGKNLTLLSVSNKGFADWLAGLSVYIIPRTRTLEVTLPMSHKQQPARVVWIFHQVVPSLALKTVGVMR
jgi:hypothetical protein